MFCRDCRFRVAVRTPYFVILLIIHKERRATRSSRTCDAFKRGPEGRTGVVAAFVFVFFVPKLPEEKSMPHRFSNLL